MKMNYLTLTSYGEKEGETYRVTLQACNVNMVTASEALVSRQGMSLYKVYVNFVDGGSGELYLSKSDLTLLEEAVGFYGVDDDGVDLDLG